MLSLSRSDDTGADRIVRSFFVRYGPVPKALFFENSFYKNGLKEWSFVKKRILSFFSGAVPDPWTSAVNGTGLRYGAAGVQRR